ncbi:D-alanine--D-alanine ligase A [Candidatus Aerophobetes bacterium]|uniref:D-alanine--D-alanine ligase n=1 Tax=Aerophobetes bacterium TaxID=2030807 RepID=A0A2A4YN18_UNCAE|nr:MAG: D-alanine--D-alanine ligase A [Candidatus Aerophobetes bacterium]
MKRVGVIFGGQSVEHEVSVQSAKNIYSSLEKDLYPYLLIGITKSGSWHYINQEALEKCYESGEFFALDDHIEVLERPVDLGNLDIDIAFPIVHGAIGEDGCMQGLFKCLNVPFVGPSVIDAAVCMDKEVCKRLLEYEDILVARFFVYHDLLEVDLEKIEDSFGYPVFIKPSNSGSSLGINKAKNREELALFVKEAFCYDHKIIVEEAIDAREFECSVMGYKDPIVSLPGEVIPTHEFYSYEAKYLDNDGARFKVPAPLDQEVTESIQEIALKAYKALCCTGMARVDFLISRQGRIYLNEVNTVPGFTKISLFPKLWELSNISYSGVLSKLIQYGFERHDHDNLLKKNIDRRVFELQTS